MLIQSLFAFTLAVAPTPGSAPDAPGPAPESSLQSIGEGKDAVLAPPPPSIEQIARINRIWRGVGIGYSNGLWGRSFAQSLRLDIPFGRRAGQFAGLRVEGQLVHPPSGTGGFYDPLVTTGLAFYGRGPVWQGLFRVYGGAGAWLGIRPNPSDVGEQLGFSGGGYFGAEFLVSSRMSFTFEIGGQGPAHALRRDDAGARAMAGLMVYLGAPRKRSR